MNNKRKDINVFLTQASVSAREAMKQLDKCTERILFVTDNRDRLLGSLTDGDLRRWILSKGELDASIENIYNKNPFFWTSDYDTAEVRQVMTSKRLDCIPVVNSERKILELLFWDDILGENNVVQSGNLNIPVVIMAGGKGTRMAPFTNILPKPLIPIRDKTILEIIMGRFQDNGIKKFHLVLNYKGEMIKAYLKNVPKSYKIRFWYEKDFFGTAGGLKLLQETINGSFIVSNCDIVVNANYEEVFNFHKKNCASMTILSSMQHHKIPYGVIQFKAGGSVEKISEKPEYTFAINTGVYILNKECFNYIPTDSYFDMNNLIDVLLKNDKKVMTYLVNESDYVDIGQWEEYKKATEKLNYLV